MFYSEFGDDSTRYADRMNNNNNVRVESLRELAVDLSEVYGLMSELCDQLQGGGIVQARDIEPSLARAVPKLRRALAALNEAATDADELGDVTAPSQSPLLM